MRKSRIFLFPLRKLIMQKIFAGKIKWICEYAGYDLWDTIILIILARKLDLSILNYCMRNANNSVMSRAILAHNLQILGKKNCTKMHKMFQGKVTILKILCQLSTDRVMSAWSFSICNLTTQQVRFQYVKEFVIRL